MTKKPSHKKIKLNYFQNLGKIDLKRLKNPQDISHLNFIENGIIDSTTKTQQKDQKIAKTKSVAKGNEGQKRQTTKNKAKTKNTLQNV